MSVRADSNGRPADARAAEGVLANLPRTRPQRSSPRRAAARKASGGERASTPPAPTTRSRQAPVEQAAPVAEPRRSAPAKSARAKAVKPSPTAKAQATSGRTRGSAKRPVKPPVESVPRQGFESDLERASGPVQPPGGPELVSAAAEIIGELAKAGVSTGERLLKDVLSRLPL